MGQYLPIFALLVLALIFGALSRVASRLLGPRHPTINKAAPYECGIVPDRDPPQRFPVRFYLVAMIFIVFDIEVVFFFPWAVAFRALGPFGLFAVLISAAGVFESFVYLISNGALDWGTVNRQVRTDLVDASRTTTSTIRRVGGEGRNEIAVAPGTEQAA